MRQAASPAGSAPTLTPSSIDGTGRPLDVLGFDDLLHGAAPVVVGEGCLDAQTSQGRIIDEVLCRVGTRVPVVGSVSGDLSDYAANFVQVIVASTAAEPRRVTARLSH